MLAKIFESLYRKVFVNIVVKRASTLVYIEMYSKKAAVDNVQAEFETIKPDENMLDYITNYTKESPYSYISVLDMSSLQGALPTCSKNKLSYYYDLSNCEYKCYNGKWTYYTAKPELYEIEKTYKEIGVDFIFSPFVVLANFFKDKIDGKLALYALVQDSFISIAVFENGKLLYAEHLDMQTSNDADDILLSHDIEEEELNLESDAGIDLEDIDVDDESSELEDFSDIEDLDSIEEIEEFDDSKDIEEELLESQDAIEESTEEEGSFNEDYQRFSLIQTSIAHYYKDERYESAFLENMYIADGVGVTKDLKKYLEEEMFLNVYIRKTEIDAEVCELAKEELGL
ncbi:hypothetical protein [Sulfurimonas paralvinellae]|uniref:Clan AA aspartic protease n=1 Tax=Sulfurimonas paralvinellae TaxID=317658 RepID=A0A7M1B8K3_9BACT|nr:hypothetical protein [Sulfurimonas paralvinellae]QOP45128.1 hypothetical protein FM071_01980 [Sulfurimonas paralvinellae]